MGFGVQQLYIFPVAIKDIDCIIKVVNDYIVCPDREVKVRTCSCPVWVSWCFVILSHYLLLKQNSNIWRRFVAYITPFLLHCSTFLVPCDTTIPLFYQPGDSDPVLQVPLIVDNCNMHYLIICKLFNTFMQLED